LLDEKRVPVRNLTWDFGVLLPFNFPTFIVASGVLWDFMENKGFEWDTLDFSARHSKFRVETIQ